MEDRASKRALEAYPKMSRVSEPHGLIPADNKSHYLGDANEEKRIGFIEGYLQAEKDLELSWEDIKAIEKLLGFDNIIESPKEFYQEVLKRFKSYGKKEI